MELLDLGPEDVDDRIDADAVDSLGRNEDDAAGVVLDAGALVNTVAVFLEPGPFSYQAI